MYSFPLSAVVFAGTMFAIAFACFGLMVCKIAVAARTVVFFLEIAGVVGDKIPFFGVLCCSAVALAMSKARRKKRRSMRDSRCSRLESLHKKEATRLKRVAAEARAQYESQSGELLAAQAELQRLKSHIARTSFHARATEASRGWRVPESPDWVATPNPTPPISRSTSPVNGRPASATPASTYPHFGEGFRSIRALSPPRRAWVPPSPLPKPEPTEGR